MSATNERDQELVESREETGRGIPPLLDSRSAPPRSLIAPLRPCPFPPKAYHKALLAGYL